MNTRTRKRFTKRCAKVEWRKAFLPWFWTCPHEYLYRKRTCPKKDFDAIAKMIDKHAVPRTWRAHSYNFLFVNGLIYWRIDECINRTDRRALNNGGYPSKPDLARIRKRFWPTKTDRLRYKELYG